VILELFTPEETWSMIEFRHAHWDVPNKFTKEAAVRIHEITSGVPRDAVLLAGIAYHIADEEDLRSIKPEVIDVAAEERSWSSRRESVEVASIT
jgi:hypothetical protein